MGKGYKRKTRWRTLNIADCPSAPPGDDDDEDSSRKPRENSTKNNTQSTHKSSHSRSSEQKNGTTENGVANRNSGGASPSRSSQPKIIFDENEYTRITTPRQDVLFKKGYLARKKVWSGNNASTSATPSTTESQSASHSTADGSETTEDPQLLDYRENGLEEISNAEPTVQMSYGTFYDHASGYYYEYPVMVVGPPIPGPPMHNLLAAMPCEPVPLRPIEWVNPAFVPKYEQNYCLVDYQNPQVDHQLPPTIDENGVAPAAAEYTNGDEPVENGNGSASWPESTAGEEPVNGDEQQLSQSLSTEDQPQDPPQEQQNYEPVIVDGSFPNEPCLETVLAQQLHVSHVGPPVPQPYMYPGHYMFGPALINVNGMTMQSGPMMRTTEMNATTAFTRRRKKKKLSRRKLKRPLGLDNSENCGQEEEEEDYSSEADNNGVQTSACLNNSFVPTSSRPLNPNCKEFEFKPGKISSSPIISHNSMAVENHERNPSDLKLQNSTIDLCSKPATIESTEGNSITPTESPAIVTNIEYATEAIANESAQTNGLANGKVNGNVNGNINGNNKNEIQETEIGVDATCAEFNDIIEKLDDNSTDYSILIQDPVDSIVPNGNEDCDRLSNGTVKSVGTNDSNDSNITMPVMIQRLSKAKAKAKENLPKNNVPKKKYNKSTKLVREPTPGPDNHFEEEHPSTSELETDLETHVEGVPMGIDAIQAQLNADTSNEDSGFESQTRFSSNHPITDAVTQWLRRANSPELFVTINHNNNEDSEMEDDELDDCEPPKNLQGNPMPALSANSNANDVKSSRPASCGEFANKKSKSRSKSKNKLKKNFCNTKNYNVKAAGHRQQRKKSRAALKLLGNNSCKEEPTGTCEFTEKDSDAGMRVANNSRITNTDKKKVVLDDKINYKELGCESSPEVDVQRINVDMVKTFQQGEIVVSIDGKLLSTTICGATVINNNHCHDDNNNNNNNNETNCRQSVDRVNSIGSIEEPDMLEFWESEKIEPFVNNNNNNNVDEKKKKENDDNSKSCIKVDPVSLDIVRKYYRLARGSVQSISSVEDGISDLNEPKSNLLEGTPEIPVLSEKNSQYKRLPIDEAIEVYESCYTGKPPSLIFNSNLYNGQFTSTSYGYGRHEKPIPCRTTCCIVQ